MNVAKVWHLGKASDLGRILVLDGSDAVGYRVTKRLMDSGVVEVRVGYKPPLKQHDSMGVEIVPFVWGDESTYSAL